jgi:hypothetical protein
MAINQSAPGPGMRRRVKAKKIWLIHAARGQIQPSFAHAAAAFARSAAASAEYCPAVKSHPQSHRVLSTGQINRLFGQRCSIDSPSRRRAGSSPDPACDLLT